MKNSKKALLRSILALLLCCSMLIGTTFAWFTDSVESGINRIVAGNLDVELEYLDANGQWKAVREDTNVFAEDTLWEPGHTEVVYLKLSNLGSLALKYQLGVNIASEKLSVNVHNDPLKLSNYIQLGVEADRDGKTNPWASRAEAVSAVSGTSKVLNTGYTGTGKLYPKDNCPVDGKTEQYVALVVYMPETVGNEANHKKGVEAPEINLGISLVATQQTAESDSFGSDYDDQSKFPTLKPGSVSGEVQTSNGLTTQAATMQGEGISANVPANVKVNKNLLTLSVSEMQGSNANISLETNELLRSLDVHIEGVAGDNTVPIRIKVERAMMIGLNAGNFTLYHVENSVPVAMTSVASLAELDAHNEFFYDPATGDVVLSMATFSEVALVANTENAWNGTVATGFAGGSGTEAEPYLIANADQLVYFGNQISNYNEEYGEKYYKLIADINLGGEVNANAGKIFYPISYHKEGGNIAAIDIDDAPEFLFFDEDPDYARNHVNAVAEGDTNTWYTYGGSFKGTFDGDGHTIANIYQNTWQLKGNYSGNYWNAAMGIFGYVNGGTVKNLTVDNFSSDGEFTPTGVIAAYAANATFENIAITNCNPRVYNTGNGGIVGIGGNSDDPDTYKLTFTNITIDNTNKISALWGSWDVACGGLVGMFRGAGHVYMTNCHVGAQIDVYNDVCGNYQYYWYRYSGMMIGTNKNMTTDANGYTVPETDNFHAENCTVHFGEWNDYYYCELVANSLASYTHDHQFSRLTEVDFVDVNNKTITVDDKTTAIPTSGKYNYVVVNGAAATENATCYHFVDGVQWTHDKAGTETVGGQTVQKEDKQHVYLPFNQLFTGYGWGVKHIPIYDNATLNPFKGITILDRATANSVEKFESSGATQLNNNKVYTLGDIFMFVDNGVALKPGALTVTVTNLDENNPVSATIEYDRNNWENGTITFNGTGRIKITIQDYYFCTPTTITVNVVDRQPEVKFDVVMNNGDFLHRVGNSGTVAVDKLFKAKSGIDVGTISVTVEAVNGTSASGTYSNNAIQFNGTGVVKVTIKDDDEYCTPTVLYLEVVDAVNATGATSATSNNVVLLNDCGFSSLEVSGGYTLYGNGFTMTCSNDAVAIDRTYSFVELKGGTLDNVKIIVPNFSHAIMYEKNKTEGGNPSNTDSSGRTRYYNIRSAVIVTANSNIVNSYISGGRVAVYPVSGTLNVLNSTIYGGAVANIQAEASSELVLEDITLVQKPIKANANDTSKTVMGFSVVMMCDTTGVGSPVTLKGYLHQYAWAHEGYTQYVPSDGKSAVSSVLAETDFIHSITYSDGTTHDSVNLGFVYMPDGTVATNADNMEDKRSDSEKTKYQYGQTKVSNVATIYTYMNSNGTDDAVKNEPSYDANTQSNVLPEVKYEDTNENRIFTTSYDEVEGKWKVTLKVDVDAGVYTFSFDKLLAQKYGKNLTYTVKTKEGTAVDKNTTITLNSAVSYVYILTITDDQIYDKNGNKLDKTSEVTYIFELLATKTSLPAPTWTSKTLNGTPYIVVDSKDGDWNCAVPVLDGLKVKYWSKKQNKEIELDLANVVSAAGLNTGLQNGSNNSITITVADEYTLTITTTGFKTNDNGKPVVVNGKLYFTVSSSSNYVSKNTTDRTPSISYVFTDANNSESITLNTSFKVAYATYKSKQYKYSDFCNGTLTEATCITPDTLITLANGTQVRVDSLKGDEMLLVWNLATGKYEAAPIVFVDSDAQTEYEIIHLYFSDGSDVKVISEHGFFDLDLGKYVYIDANNYADYVGHRFVAEGNIAANEWNVVTLDQVVLETEVTTAWSPVTFQHLCYYTNGILSMPGGIDGLFNIFEVDTETMTYDAEQMQKDIETYGLLTLEDFGGMITQDAFDAFNGQWLMVSIGKGLLTWEDIAYMAERYIPLM